MNRRAFIKGVAALAVMPFVPAPLMPPPFHPPGSALTGWIPMLKNGQAAIEQTKTRALGHGLVFLDAPERIIPTRVFRKGEPVVLEIRA